MDGANPWYAFTMMLANIERGIIASITFRTGKLLVLGFLGIILDDTNEGPKNSADHTEGNGWSEDGKQRLRCRLNDPLCHGD